MPQTVKTLDQDTIDLVVYRTLGVVNEALLKETHDLNPHLSNYGNTLPYSIEVEVPDRPTDAETVERTVKLYD